MGKPKKKVNTGIPYEKAAEAYFRKRFPGCTVQHNVKVQGNRDTEQIDILVTFEKDGLEFVVAVEAKDYNTRLNKDRFAPIEVKFKSIRASIGIILCANGVQSGFQRRIETSDLKLELVVLNFDQLVEGSWSEDFLEAIEDLKAAKEAAEISDELAQKVGLAIETQPHYARYFFHDLENPAWLPILAGSGLFERCFADNSKLNGNLLSDYVCRNAVTDEAAFLRFARAFRPPHGWIEDDLFAVAMKVSPETRHELVRIAGGWEKVNIFGTKEIRELVTMSIREGQADDGLNLLSNLTAITVVEERWENGGTTYRLTTALNDHWYQELTLKLFPQLAAESPQLCLPYARARLAGAMESKYPEHKDDFPGWVCRHIGVDEQHGPFGTLHVLACAYRDALLAVPDKEVDALRSECETVLGGTNVGAVRCVLHAISQRFDRLGDLSEKILIREDLWNDSSTEPELVSLLEKNWSTLSEAHQERVCDRVVNLKAEKYSEDEREEQVEERRKRKVAEWLVVLNAFKLPPSRETEIRQMYETYSAETGITSRPELSSPRFYSVDSVPDIAERFEDVSAKEVLQACIDFQPDSVGLDHKTPEGLSRKLKEEITRRPDQFLVELDLVKDLPYPAYRSAVINGLAEACKGGKVKASECLSIVNCALSGAIGKDDEPKGEHDNGSKRWVRMEAAKFIRDAGGVSQSNISLEDIRGLYELWLRLRDLTRHDTTTRLTGIPGFVNQALNSVLGQLGMGLASLLALVLGRLNLEELTLAERQGLEKLRAAFKQQVQEFSLGSDEPVTRCPIGRLVPELMHWDVGVISEHVDQWLPSNKPSLGLSFLEGYYGRRSMYPEMVRLLGTKYLEIDPLLKDDKVRGEWCSGLATERVIFWWTGELKDTDPLMKSFLKNARIDDLESAIHWIGPKLANGEVEAWRKAIRFWKLVLKKRKDAGEALHRVYFSLENLPDYIPVEEFLDVLKAGNDVSELYVGEEALEVILKRAATEPKAVAELILSIAKAKLKWIPNYLVKQLKEAAATCHEIGDSEVKELIRDVKRAMLKRGVMGFEDLAA